jgi:hypothetical protein
MYVMIVAMIHTSFYLYLIITYSLRLLYILCNFRVKSLKGIDTKQNGQNG